MSCDSHGRIRARRIRVLLAGGPGFRAWLWVGVFLAFFVAFRWGTHLVAIDLILSTNASDFFREFQTDSDDLVIGRLRQSVAAGVFSAGISLGEGGWYWSQLGLGGWALTLLPALLRLPEDLAITLMYSAAAGFNALLATAAILMTARVLSRGAAGLVAITLLQPWPVAMAKSIYWMIGLKAVPAVALIVLFSSRRDTPWRMVTVAALSSVIVFLSGYEYLTVVIALQLSVVAYYSLLRGWPMRQTVGSIIGLVLSAVLALALALGLHFVQLMLRMGSPGAALRGLQEVATKRTGVTTLEVEPLLTPSLASSPWEVLATYLAMPILGAPWNVPFVSGLTVTILVVVCAFALLTGFAHREPSIGSTREQALGLAWVVGLLGPVGWFLVARPHSYIHTHINFALWFLPTAPLGMALLWRPLRDGVRGLARDRTTTTWLVLVLTALVVFFLYSIGAMRAQ